MESTQTTIKDDAFLSDTFWLSTELLNDILNQLQHIDKVSPNSPISWNLLVTELTQDISRFVEITALLSRVALASYRGLISLIKESHVHLLFVLKAIHQAQQKGDLVALEDLIKYELKDNLTQWKIDLFPKIKRLLKG